MKFLKTREEVALHFLALFIVLCFIILNDYYYFYLVPFVAYFIYFLVLRYVGNKKKLQLVNKILKFYIIFRFICLIIIARVILSKGMIFNFFSILNYLFILIFLESFILSKLSSKNGRRKDFPSPMAFSFSIISIVYLVIELSIYYLSYKTISFYTVAGCIVCMLLRLLLIRYFDLLK